MMVYAFVVCQNNERRKHLTLRIWEIKPLGLIKIFHPYFAIYRSFHNLFSISIIEFLSQFLTFSIVYKFYLQHPCWDATYEANGQYLPKSICNWSLASTHNHHRLNIRSGQNFQLLWQLHIDWLDFILHDDICNEEILVTLSHPNYLTKIHFILLCFIRKIHFNEPVVG